MDSRRCRMTKPDHDGQTRHSASRTQVLTVVELALRAAFTRDIERVLGRYFDRRDKHAIAEKH